MPAKEARITFLGTPEFKAFLEAEARREGISLSELIRRRCQAERVSEEEQVLAALIPQVQAATERARCTLNRGLGDAEAALQELRALAAKSVAAKRRSSP